VANHGECQALSEAALLQWRFAERELCLVLPKRSYAYQENVLLMCQPTDHLAGTLATTDDAVPAGTLKRSCAIIPLLAHYVLR